jgi:hypothetical protein
MVQQLRKRSLLVSLGTLMLILSTSACGAAGEPVKQKSPPVEEQSIPLPGGNAQWSARMNTLRADGGRLKYGMVNFNKASQKTVDWMDDRFALRIGGDKGSKKLKSLRMQYVDFHRLATIKMYLEMKDFAGRNGFAAEGMLLHVKNDFTPKSPPTSKQLDMFDVFEGKNGVIKSFDDKKFIDVTDKAYRGEVELADINYIGYEEPFDQINFEMKRPAVQTVLAVSYWNGAKWSTLAVSDGTSGLTGNGSITFQPPSDWSVKSVNLSRKKFFVRLAFSKFKSLPITTRIHGDSWYNDAGKTCRGWDNSSKQILDLGFTRYNPSPAATSSARFPYQGRLCPIGAPYQFIANPAEIQTSGGKSQRPFAQYLAEYIIENTNDTEFDGVMGDEAERGLIYDGLVETKTDFSDKARKDWSAEKAALVREIVATVREKNASLLVGVNGMKKDLIYNSDWSLAEYISNTYKTQSPLFMNSDPKSPGIAYDDYLPARNPKGSVGFLIHVDAAATVSDKHIEWDRANRGPLTALSLHYICMNENTVFGYYSRGGWVYDESDEVYLKDGSVIHLASGKMPKLEEVMRWANWFPAMDVVLGNPDLKGYNKGSRSVPWKKGMELGGGVDIWRRDFEKGLVFHRAAGWSTTAEAYQTYSQPVDLGRDYYPLRADGTTEPAVRFIKLRAGEGAIFMKFPIHAGKGGQS